MVPRVGAEGRGGAVLWGGVAGVGGGRYGELEGEEVGRGGHGGGGWGGLGGGGAGVGSIWVGGRGVGESGWWGRVGGGWVVVGGIREGATLGAVDGGGGGWSGLWGRGSGGAGRGFGGGRGLWWGVWGGGGGPSGREEGGVGWGMGGGGVWGVGRWGVAGAAVGGRWGGGGAGWRVGSGGWGGWGWGGGGADRVWSAASTRRDRASAPHAAPLQNWLRAPSARVPNRSSSNSSWYPSRLVDPSLPRSSARRRRPADVPRRADRTADRAGGLGPDNAVVEGFHAAAAAAAGKSPRSAGRAARHRALTDPAPSRSRGRARFEGEAFVERHALTGAMERSRRSSPPPTRLLAVYDGRQKTPRVAERAAALARPPSVGRA